MNPRSSHHPLSQFPLALALLSVACAALAGTPTVKHPKYNEMPKHFDVKTQSFNYQRRAVDIPMRDGVKLHTVILVPDCAKNAGIVLTRTPYNAEKMTRHTMSGHLGPMLQGYDNITDIIMEDCYIRVVQDVRGKYGSEGAYVMNRPLASGPLNPTKVDDSTDAYDTIDWLVHNVPESNGRVGIIGISYDGFEPLMALVNPNPALKVAVPMNPMVDGWMGDDWLHHGAFREQMLPYIYEQEATRDNHIKWWSNYHNDYDLYMNAGSAGAVAKKHGMKQLGFWRELAKHPSYDEYWQSQAMDKILAKQPLKVPTMLVAGLWDQEDMYGAPAVYRAIEPKDTNNDKVYLVIGPWFHGQQLYNGSSLGAIEFGSDTAAYFREHILRPFLAHYLKSDTPPMHVAPVNAYVTGADHWEKLDHWPAGCANGCKIKPTPLYLKADNRLGFKPPRSGNANYDQYISDPANPVTYRQRPIHPRSSPRSTWHQWLVDDQRFAANRPDVLVYETAVLKKPVKISGRPIVHLIAATSGTDSDWVVKLIDVYPDQVARRPEMSGYQLPITMNIFRGRYRQSYSKPKPIKADTPLEYRFPLPIANHVFEPGHRIMVQIQSSWFPLYDRNPQTFIDNIMFAKPGDFVKATQRVYHEPKHASYIKLPLVTQ
jgi:putative CocE/NonD family hydrolase